MADNEMYVILGIGLSLFSFLALLLAMGQAYGGNWQLVAQGFTYFIVIIVGFAIACFVLAELLRRH
jgi:hypothetical protein